MKRKPVTTPPASRQPRVLRPNDVRMIVQDVLREEGLHKTQADLQVIASGAARQVLHEMLMSMGVDISNPIATQEMFSGLREVVRTFGDEEFQRDMQRMRTWRRTMDHVQSKGLLTMVGLAITAIAIMLYPRLGGTQ